MPNDLDTTIQENAIGPAKATGDSGSIEQHKLGDQIAADRYLNAKVASEKERRGLIFNKFVPPGAS